MNTETLQEKEIAPIPLESLPPLPEQNSGKEWEKGRYWNQLLTGDLSSVPLAVRQKAGAEDESRPLEERNYRLMANINRSWVVDHKQMEREEVRTKWPELRRNMAQELQVRDSEAEVYSALSLQHQDKPTREKVRKQYEQHYQSALKAETNAAPDGEEADEVALAAWEDARAARDEYMPLAEQVAHGWSAIKAYETKMFSLPEMAINAPDLFRAVESLADMPPAERAKVYTLAQSLNISDQPEKQSENLGEAMLHSVRRGVSDLGHSMLQGAGHIATALTRSAAETVDSDLMRSASEGMDKRLQVMDELRRVGQSEVFPIDLGEDSSFWEELAVDSAGAVPSAAMAFMGGAGFGLLTLAGTGAAVAEARRRAPEGRQELQTAAGVVGGALQAGIYMGMSRIGANMLNRSIGEFVKARHAGARGYSLAALKTLGTLTAENTKLLLAGKLAQASELGMQELAARVDKVASNIDWESFGSNITDIETNMREAAMNLPFILIAAGRAALHHFRNPAGILESGDLLAEWGVDEKARARMMAEPNIFTQGDMLRQLLRGSKRWSGGGAIEEFARALRLLNTADQVAFRNTDEVRAFLDFGGKNEFEAHTRLPKPDVTDPAAVQQVVERITGRKTPMVNAEKRMPYLLLMEEWYQKSQGRFALTPEQRREHSRKYLDMIDEPHRVLNRNVKLDGYYLPNRVELMRTLWGDAVREAQDLSYLSLLNIETLDSVVRSYRSINIAREKSEHHRKQILSVLCRAVHRCFQSRSTEKPFAEMTDAIRDIYLLRRHNARHSPDWLRKTTPPMLNHALDKMRMKELRPNMRENPKLGELRHIVLGLRACGEVLFRLIPHTEEYQDSLSLGYNPVEAAQITLQHMFRGDVLPEVWPPKPVEDIRPNEIDNRHRFGKNKDALLHYMELSGVRPESSPDGEGNLLWRLKRPDGRYTPWLPSKVMAGNALAGNVQTLYLPMGDDALLANIRRAIRFGPNGIRYFWRRHMFPERHRTLLGFDHLGTAATRDLCALWMGTSSLYNAGLEFTSSKHGWLKHKGVKLDSDLKLWDSATNHYLVKYQKVLSPPQLAQLRFRAYWNRMLTSGWISPEEVADALIKTGVVGSHVMADILEKGKDHVVDFRYRPAQERAKYRSGELPRVRKGDVIKMNAILAGHMARLNTAYMMHNLRNLDLPDSVKQWFYSSLFSNYRFDEDEVHPRKPLSVYTNRLAAESVKDIMPLVNRMRLSFARNEDYPLQKYLHEAIQPAESQRYENGWCYSIGGEGAYRASGQHVWNLLRDPARGWKLLDEDNRAHITEEIKDFCGGRSPEEALQELSEVLQQYPELHAYNVNSRQSPELSRMELNPIKTRDLVEPIYTVYENTRLFRPWVVKKDYQVEQGIELPAEIQQDARVLPALRLLTELRRVVTTAPYADDSGIWWDGERYGGLSGKRPNGVDENWKPEPVLNPLLEFYGSTYRETLQQGKNGKLNVCGVELGGLQPEDLDVSRLQNITVYRNPLYPEHMLRLMPGETDAASPFQRVPYIMHTADGIPLFKTRMAHHYSEFIQALSPLNRFANNMERSYTHDTNKEYRRRLVNLGMKVLLRERSLSPRRWIETDESGINNLELFMELFQDSRLPYFLAGKNPTELNRGEALLSELGRLMLLAECGTDRMAGVRELVQFCDKLRESKHDVKLMKAVLERVVSPFPNEYLEIEQTPTSPELKPDTPDTDVEQH